VLTWKSGALGKVETDSYRCAGISRSASEILNSNTLRFSPLDAICYASGTEDRILLFLNLGNDICPEAVQAKFVFAVIHLNKIVFWPLLQTNAADNAFLRRYFIS
jgi:hypothetical protein